MEQIIFLHSDEESEEALILAQKSLAQRLVLVVPTSMDRPRLSMLLRLIRRSAAQRAQQLYLVSEEHLLRILAERMGYLVAATLDEYRGLAPGNVSSTRKPIQRATAVQSFPSARPATTPPGQRLSATTQKPGAQLETMLVDGYLPNPGAIPSLEEEEEQAEWEEPERLHYEIADENSPSLAQQEAEAHEARIIATILKTSVLDSQSVPSPAPADPNDDRKTSTLPAQAKRDEEEGEDSPPASADLDEDPDEDPAYLPYSDQAEQPSPELSHPPPSLPEEEDGLEPGVFKEEWDGRLQPMRTIDELLAERGQADIFEWFARQVAAQQKEE